MSDNASRQATVIDVHPKVRLMIQSDPVTRWADDFAVAQFTDWSIVFDDGAVKLLELESAVGDIERPLCHHNRLPGILALVRKLCHELKLQAFQGQRSRRLQKVGTRPHSLGT